MKKKEFTEDVVLECMDYYIPRWVESASDFGVKIRVKGQTGDAKEYGREMVPRLKHRSDYREYISRKEDDKGSLLAWSSGKYGEGFITHPEYVNPNRGHSGVALGVVVLWESFDSSLFEGIVGVLNGNPILVWEGFDGHLPEGNCLYKQNGCPHSTTSCNCIWRPHQIIFWGKIEGGNFQHLQEPIFGPKIDIFEFARKIKNKMPKIQWLTFRNTIVKKYEDEMKAAFKLEEKESELALDNIAALKILDNFKLFQRADFSSMNCYALPFHQAGIAIDTGYLQPAVPYIRLIFNSRTPVSETVSQANKRLGVTVEEEEELSKEEPKKAENKKPKKKFVKVEPEYDEDDEDITEEEVLDLFDDDDDDNEPDEKEIVDDIYIEDEEEEELEIDDE